MELTEVTVQSDPAELRLMASFLLSCALGMERDGHDWGHEHFSDFVGRDGPDLVVASSDGQGGQR
jgi:hypothetical protein